MESKLPGMLALGRCSRCEGKGFVVCEGCDGKDGRASCAGCHGKKVVPCPKCTDAVPDRAAFIEKIKVLDMREGDILVLRYSGRLSDEAVRHLKDSVESIGFPRNKTLILEEGMDLKVIRSESLKAELDAK